MKASVLITCHNDGATLGSALFSVVTQREVREILLMTHGCTDESDLVAEYASRAFGLDAFVGYLALSQSAALNRLASRASTDWLIVLNADDLLAPRAVETITEIARTQPGVNLIYSPWQWIGARSDRYEFAPYTGDARMLTEHQIPGIAAFRRDLWEALGGLDEAVGIGADWDFAVRAAARGLLKPYMHPEPLWFVRHHGERQKERLSAQCDHGALRKHMAQHFEGARC